MDKSISPYDLGVSQLVEHAQRVSIDNLVRKAKSDLKRRLVEAQVEVLGAKIDLSTTKTRFNGERLWFLCPQCSKRTNYIYNHPITSALGCRHCLGFKYLKQRYKGMLEGR